jgi:hypothetical protein
MRKIDRPRLRSIVSFVKTGTPSPTFFSTLGILADWPPTPNLSQHRFDPQINRLAWLNKRICRIIFPDL